MARSLPQPGAQLSYTELGLVFAHARVAKLADARDLKSRAPKRAYRFDSDPGHQHIVGDPSTALGISPAGSDARKTAQLKIPGPQKGVSVRFRGVPNLCRI